MVHRHSMMNCSYGKESYEGDLQVLRSSRHLVVPYAKLSSSVPILILGQSIRSTALLQLAQHQETWEIFPRRGGTDPGVHGQRGYRTHEILLILSRVLVFVTMDKLRVDTRHMPNWSRTVHCVSGFQAPASLWKSAHSKQSPFVLTTPTVRLLLTIALAQDLGPAWLSSPRRAKWALPIANHCQRRYHTV